MPRVKRQLPSIKRSIKSNITSFMYLSSLAILHPHEHRPGTGDTHRGRLHLARENRTRPHAGALLPLPPRRAALLGVLHRPYPKPQHPARLPHRRPALRRLVRTTRPRPRPGGTHGGRGLRRAALRSARRPERQAAPGGAAHALRLARGRSGPPLQSRKLGARAQTRRQVRQDPGALRLRGPGPCSTASTSRRSQVSATARSSGCWSTASRVSRPRSP